MEMTNKNKYEEEATTVAKYRLNSIDAYKSNEEWVRDNVPKAQESAIANQGLSEELIQMIKRFDENVNPFMNKFLLVDDFSEISKSVDIDIDTNENAITFSLPDIGITIFSKREVSKESQIDYSLMYGVKIEDMSGNLFEVMHIAFYWGNAFWVSDGQIKKFFGSELYKNDEQTASLMEFLESANIILEEEFIPVMGKTLNNNLRRVLVKE